MNNKLMFMYTIIALHFCMPIFCMTPAPFTAYQHLRKALSITNFSTTLAKQIDNKYFDTFEENLRKCSSLEDLNLAGQNITNVSALKLNTIIAKLHLLSSVDISNTRLNDVSVTTVAKALIETEHPHLKCFNITGLTINNAISSLCELASKYPNCKILIDTVKLPLPSSSGPNFAPIIRCANKVLFVSNTIITKAMFDTLGNGLNKNAYLTSLDLSYTKPDTEGLKSLSKVLCTCTNLESINLSRCNLDRSILDSNEPLSLCASLALLKTLTNLNLEGTSIEASMLPNLEKIAQANPNITIEMDFVSLSLESGKLLLQ